MNQSDLRQLVDLASVETLQRGEPVNTDLPEGARIVDHWIRLRFGAVLVRLTGGLTVNRFLPSELNLYSYEEIDGRWEKCGGGGHGLREVKDIIAQRGPGLHAIGAERQDQVRLTTAIASPEIAWIQMQSDRSVTKRRLGADAFCLLGAVDSDGEAQAQGLDKSGSAVGRPIVL